MPAIPNMMEMMKQLQKMQEKMQQVQQALEARTVTGESGGGLVKVTVNGRQHIVDVKIDKEAIDPSDPGMLEDLVVAAANRALDDAAKLAQEEVAKATSGMLPTIPGLNLPGM